MAWQVTLGMCLVGAVPWIRGSLIFVSQIIGGIAAAGIVAALFPGGLLIRTTLDAGTSVVQGLFIEMFLTAQLVFTIFMLAAEKHKATFIAPVGIGLSLFIAELSGVSHRSRTESQGLRTLTDNIQVFFTGGSLNPTRSFGPCVILHSFEEYHWIYWVGPVLGSIVAAGFYKFIKILEYETANPGQDINDVEAQVRDAGQDALRTIPVAPDTNDSSSTGMLGREATSNREQTEGLNGSPVGRTAYPRSGVISHLLRDGPVPRTPTSKIAGGLSTVGTSLPIRDGCSNPTPKVIPVPVPRDDAATEVRSPLPQRAGRT